MSRRIGILFLTLYLISVMRPVFPFLEYAVYYEYIATVLCINKEEPKMQCNGKCHLSAQLSKYTQDEDSDGNKEIFVELEKYPVYYYEHHKPAFIEFYLNRTEGFKRLNMPIIKDFSELNIPPPKCII